MTHEPVFRHPNHLITGRTHTIVRTEYHDVRGALIGVHRAGRVIFTLKDGGAFVRTKDGDLPVEYDAAGLPFYVVATGKVHAPAVRNKNRGGPVKPGTIRLMPDDARTARGLVESARQAAKTYEHLFNYQPDNHHLVEGMHKLRADLESLILVFDNNTKR